VHVGPGCVKVECPTAGPVYLDPFQAYRLRDALRETVTDLGLLGGAEELSQTPPEQPLPAAAVPAARRAVVLGLRPDDPRWSTSPLVSLPLILLSTRSRS